MKNLNEIKDEVSNLYWEKNLDTEEIKKILKLGKKSIFKLIHPRLSELNCEICDEKMAYTSKVKLASNCPVCINKNCGKEKKVVKLKLLQPPPVEKVQKDKAQDLGEHLFDGPFGQTAYKMHQAIKELKKVNESDYRMIMAIKKTLRKFPHYETQAVDAFYFAISTDVENWKKIMSATLDFWLKIGRPLKFIKNEEFLTDKQSHYLLILLKKTGRRVSDFYPHKALAHLTVKEAQILIKTLKQIDEVN